MSQLVWAWDSQSAASFTVPAVIAPLPPTQAFHCPAAVSDQDTQVQLLAGTGRLTERSVPSLSSMPTATLMPLPPA